MIRPPRHLQDLRAAVLGSQPALAQLPGREPGLEEIAEALGEDPGTVAEALTCLNSCGRSRWKPRRRTAHSRWRRN